MNARIALMCLLLAGCSRGDPPPLPLCVLIVNAEGYVLANTIENPACVTELREQQP